jgi:tetratricopeptide (TPR) repeat protein
MRSSNRFFPILSSIVCTLVIVLLAPTPTFAKDNWTVVRSKNFTLVGNASEKEIKQVATRMEQFRDVFARLFPNLPLASPVPTTVVVFKSDGSFKPYKPVEDGKTASVAGYFQSGRDANYIALSTESRAESPYRTIFHEYVHLLVNNTLGQAGVPPWFNEGLAEYYSTFEIDDGRKVFLGKPVDHHLYMLRSTKLFPLETLFGVDYYSLKRNKHDSRSLFYAQSWALVHYLIQGNEGKRVPSLGKFLDLLMRNTPVETAFREAFQMDFRTLEKELKQYVNQTSYRINVATFEKKLEFDSEMQSTPITEAEGQAYLGDLLFHIRRFDSAVEKLREALALDPNLAMAHASLGMAYMEQKNWVEAKAHLEKAVEADSKNYLAHYYHALMLSREHMDEHDRVSSYPAGTSKMMRTRLHRAIELKPDFAESYKLLAFINLVADENLDESLTLINKAIALSPGSEEYVFVLAQIYLRQRNFAAARKSVERLAASASDPQMRANAESLLKSIISYEQQVANYEKQRAARSSLAPSEITTTSVESGPPQQAPTDPHSYLEEALRKPEPGETRVLGVLTRIDCSPKSIVFTVKVGSRLYAFAAPSFDAIDITTYISDVGGELTCGIRRTEDAVVVTYKSSSNQNKVDGVPVVLEFVPKEFKFKQQ